MYRAFLQFFANVYFKIFGPHGVSIELIEAPPPAPGVEYPGPPAFKWQPLDEPISVLITCYRILYMRTFTHYAVGKNSMVELLMNHHIDGDFGFGDEGHAWHMTYNMTARPSAFAVEDGELFVYRAKLGSGDLTFSKVVNGGRTDFVAEAVAQRIGAVKKCRVGTLQSAV